MYVHPCVYLAVMYSGLVRGEGSVGVLTHGSMLKVVRILAM
jgi:hypothetical protein